ncbi:MAG: MSMEG_0565 family glycosyltransferase [Roseiflexaceae bacterium]
MTTTRQSNDALRIAIFTYSTKPRGGVIHTLALAEHLQALGHDVHIFALGKDQRSFFRPTTAPFTLIPFAALPDDAGMDEKIKGYIQSYYEFLMAHQSDPFDIYHVQDCVSANAVWRVREEGRIGWFVRTVHHMDDFVSPSLIQCQNDSVYRPDHRIVVSRDWQQRLRDEFGVASEVIYNGVDQRFAPPDAAQRAAARSELGVVDAFVFLNIGGIEPRKNTTRLVTAFSRVRRELELKGRRSVLLLAGGETLLDYTPYRDEFFALLSRADLQLDKDIRLLGVIPDEQMPLLYHAADTLAFPSIKEGWGLVAVESLASGLPVLTSDLPVFREYLRSEHDALLVDPLDEAAIAAGMLRLAEDEGFRRRLATAGPQTARKFSWEACARAHVEWYRRWLAERRRD